MNALRFLDIPYQPFGAPSLMEVSRHFIERTINPAVAIEWLIGLSAFIVILLVVILFLAIRSRRRTYMPEDWIVDPHAIREMLQLAMDQRSRFELRFKSLNDGRRPALRCAGVRLEGLFITLEISGLQILSSRWDGKEADCFFQIVGQGQILHHAFETKVKDVFTRDDQCFLRIAIPNRLESRQKRSYLRIAPPDEFLLGAAIWCGEGLPDDDIRTKLQLWNKPTLAFLPSHSSQFSVTDISAGGARIHITRQFLTEEIKHISISDRLIFMIDLWDPTKAQRQRYWMLCRVQNPALDFSTKNMDVGLQFLAWARPKDGVEHGSELEWLRLSLSGEVEPLGNWIMRRHLELFRESEQEAR